VIRGKRGRNRDNEREREKESTSKATVLMTHTWRDNTSIIVLIRFAAGSQGLLIAAHLIIASKMGGKVGLICGSCWSGKYSTYESADSSLSCYQDLKLFDFPILIGPFCKDRRLFTITPRNDCSVISKCG